MTEKRRMPVRVTSIELPEPYEGWTAKVRTNMSVATYDRIFSSGWDVRYGALADVVQEWNYVDDEGEAIPVTEEGMQMLSMEMIVALMQEIDEAVAAPLTAMQMRKTRKRARKRA